MRLLSIVWLEEPEGPVEKVKNEEEQGEHVKEDGVDPGQLLPSVDLFNLLEPLWNQISPAFLWT